MKFIAVDDEKFALKDITDAVRQAEPNAQLNEFISPKAALDFASKNTIDVAFLDIEMGGLSGLELAKKLKDINSKTNIVFVTGYADYAVDSYSVSASGYILKPVSAGAVRNAMDNLRNPVVRTDKKLKVQCFGNFEVFAQGRPVHFSRSKSKEIFAYLIHKKGSGCTTRELTSILFEDNDEQSMLHKHIQTYISAMIKTLKEADANDVIIKKFNDISVNIDKVNCDFYRFLLGDIEAVNSYTGEYMANYSWAEFTVGYLNRMVYKE